MDNRNKAEKRDRDANVELMRIIACLLVILLHIRLMAVENGIIRDSVLLMQTFTSIAVGTFFLITGFFTPNQGSVIRVWKGFLRSVALPALLLVVAVNILGPWLDDEAGLGEAILQFDLPDFLERLFRGILGFDVSFLGNGCAHLWFIFSYALIMIWAPAIMLFARNGAGRLLIFYASIALLRLLLIDITKMTGIPVVIYLVELGPVEVLYFVLGYLIYSKRDKLRSCRPAFLILGFLSLLWFMLIFFVQKHYFMLQLKQGMDDFTVNVSGTYYIDWSSFCGVAASSLTGAALLSLSLRNKRLRTAINYMGSLTFPIYLLHYPIVMKINAMGFGGLLQSLFRADTVMGSFVYTVVYTLLVFLATGAIVIIWRYIRSGLYIKLRYGYHK